MDTTAAAAQAGVTIPTIRTWCRIGAVAAIKRAGRWVIDSDSLAHRITIGKRRTHKETRTVPAINLTATYTWNEADQPTTVTPKVSTRTTPDGKQLTTIRGLAPLLADHINAIPDEGDRLHTLTVLTGATVVISDQPRDIATGMVTTRDDGRLATNYQGTRHLPIDRVLDLAEQLRAAI